MVDWSAIYQPTDPSSNALTKSRLRAVSQASYNSLRGRHAGWPTLEDTVDGMSVVYVEQAQTRVIAARCVRLAAARPLRKQKAGRRTIDPRCHQSIGRSCPLDPVFKR